MSLKMSNFYRISTPQDELEYLKRIHDLDGQLQRKYAKNFFQQHNMQRKYEKVFQPITKPLKMLQQQNIPDSSSEVVSHAPIKHEHHEEGIKEEEQSFLDDNEELMSEGDYDGDDADSDFDISHFLRSPHFYTAPDKYFGITEDKKDKKAYNFVGRKIHILGTPPTAIKVIFPTQLKQVIDIPSQKIWEIIVLEHPINKITHSELVQYGKILTTIGFQKWISNQKTTAKKQALLNSVKYNTIILPALEAVATDDDHKGEGIHYTYHSPHYYRNKNKKDINRTKNGIVEFFPADKKELLNKLVYLLGEYHSGNNKSLRNEIVPIVSYLRSHNALPYKFDKRRMNWIYD